MKRLAIASSWVVGVTCPLKGRSGETPHRACHQGAHCARAFRFPGAVGEAILAPSGSEARGAARAETGGRCDPAVTGVPRSPSPPSPPRLSYKMGLRVDPSLWIVVELMT